MLGFYSAKPFLIKNPTEILDDIGNNLIRRLFITSFFFLIGKNWKTQNVLKLGILGGKFDRPKMDSNVAVIMLYHARDISKRIPMIILP